MVNGHTSCNIHQGSTAKLLMAASLFQNPDLWLRRLKELRMHPTTSIVIYGYLVLVSYSNSKQALSRVLKHLLLAVNK